MIHLYTRNVYSGPDVQPHHPRLMQDLPVNSIKLRAWIQSKHLIWQERGDGDPHNTQVWRPSPGDHGAGTLK